MFGKVLGIWPVTSRFDFPRREGMYTTLLMSTGLTFGTISALFGLTNHIIDQGQYTILVTVVIASAVVPTLIAQRCFEPVPAEPAMSAPVPASTRHRVPQPDRLRRNHPMFARILVGLDGSEAAHHALVALDLAALSGAEVHAVSVEEHLPAYAATVGEVQDEDRFEHEYFDGGIARARLTAAERGIRFDSSIVPGHAAQALARLARELGCDLIVLGHTGHSRLHHLFLGSTADRVVERAHCPVLVVR